MATLNTSLGTLPQLCGFSLRVPDVKIPLLDILVCGVVITLGVELVPSKARGF